MHHFCLEIVFMGVIRCGQIFWVVIKNNASNPEIWNNKVMYFNPVSCHLMFFSHKIKCNIEPPSKTTSSTSFKITGVLENKTSYGSSMRWFFSFLHLNCWFKQRWEIYSQFMSFAIVKANISNGCLKNYWDNRSGNKSSFTFTAKFNKCFLW